MKNRIITISREFGSGGKKNQGYGQKEKCIEPIADIYR